MLKVTYSQDLAALAEALADELAAARGAGELDLFDAVAVVVPGRAVAAFVELTVARTLGVAANLRFPSLEGFLADVAQRSLPGARIVDRRLLHMLIERALGDDGLLARAELGLVRAYLAAPGADGVRQRLELAGELAALFGEYELGRPDWLAAWRRGEPAAVDEAARRDEPWQRAVWRAVLGPQGLLARLAGGRPWGSATALLAGVAARDLVLPRRTFAIGFSHLPPAHLDALDRMARLAPAASIHLLLPSPCREFWDDIGEDAAEAPLLALWGRTHRELARRVGDRTGMNDEQRFVEPAEPTTALAALQRDTLVRARVEPGRRHREPGIEVLGCAGVRRELEAIAGEIGVLLAADPTLTLDDVAVLHAGPAAARAVYQAHAAAVFREHGDLPHHLVDVPLARESRIAEAVRLLLDLPLGELTRPELLGVLVHPAVLAGHPQVDRDDWVGWVSRLGIFRGGDQRDHAGTYIDEDVFSWDQGVRRLALGAVMEGERSGELRSVALGRSRYLPEEVAASELGSAARFARLVRRLVAAARAARAEPRPLAEWARFADHLVADHVRASDEAGEVELRRCRAAIARLADLDVDGAAVPFAVARALLEDELGGLCGGVGDLLAGGVLIAPLGHAPLPFRVIFVAGLGEACFPAREAGGGLDLRAGARRPGDRDRRDRDLAALLEAVLGARDRLILSYVARDEQSGDRLEVSSAVLDLLDAVRGRVEDPARLRRELPLRRFEAPAAADAIGQRQARARALRLDLAAHRAARGAPPPGEEALRRALARAEDPALRRLFGLEPAAPAAPAPPGIGGRALSLAALRRFLEDPVQAWADVVLGVADEEEADDRTTSDEPIERDRLASALLLRDVVGGFLLAGGGAAAALAVRYREVAARAGLTGHAPVGRLGEIQRAVDADGLARIHAALAGRDGRCEAATAVGFGPLRAGALVSERRPPLGLATAAGEVGLIGATAPCAPAAGLVVVVVSQKIGVRHLLRAAIDLCALVADGRLPPGRRRFTIASTSGAIGRHVLSLASGEAARSYLAALAGELCADRHDYLLPGEAAWQFLADRGKASLAQRVERAVDAAEQRPWRSGPVRRLDRLDLPAAAEAIAARRLGFLVERITVDDEGPP